MAAGFTVCIHMFQDANPAALTHNICESINLNHHTQFSPALRQGLRYLAVGAKLGS